MWRIFASLILEVSRFANDTDKLFYLKLCFWVYGNDKTVKENEKKKSRTQNVVKEAEFLCSLLDFISFYELLQIFFNTENTEFPQKEM